MGIIFMMFIILHIYVLCPFSVGVLYVVIKRTEDLMGCLLCSSQGYPPTPGLLWSWEVQGRS